MLFVCSLVLFVSGCSPKPHHVHLSWDAPQNSPVAVVGYNVYRSTGANYQYRRLNTSLIKGTTFEDYLAQSGRSYDYAVRSVSASGIESPPSNMVHVTIP